MLNFALILLLLTGCSQNGGLSTESKITLSLGTTNAFPGVVRIVSRVSCTATVISERAVLTAAHCLNQGGDLKIRYNDQEYLPSNVLVNAKSGEESSQDIGIVILDAPVFSTKDKLSISKKADKGDEVILIGYGCEDMQSRKGSGIKRLGKNKIEKISDYIEVMTPLNRGIVGPLDKAGSCFGDSGSPLLLPNGSQFDIVGVDHGAYNEDGKQYSEYVNLLKPENTDFIIRVNKEYQLNITGLE